MTEQIPAHNTSNAPPSPGQEYGWPDVAREMHTWHPDLQRHAAAKLEEHNVPSAHVTVPRLALVGESPTEVSEGQASSVGSKTETIAEIPRDPSEKIVDAFADSQNALLKLSNDPHFHEACLQQGIDPYEDMDKPAYWRLFSSHAGQKVRKLCERAGNSPQLMAFELTAATPAFVFDTAAGDKGNLPPEESRQAKKRLSTFNETIRKFAREYPDTRVADVEFAILNAMNTTIEDKTLRQTITPKVRQVLRGAQHENAYGQVLRKADIAFRESDLEEDLSGIDYVITDRTFGRPLFVDVKASLTEVQRRKDAEHSAYAYKGNRLVMYSLAKDEEFGGKFYLPDNVAATKVDPMLYLLRQADSQRRTG